MSETRYKIDAYSVEFYAVDRKGSRLRWGDRVLKLYAEGREVAKAVFSNEISQIPEPYISDGKIHYFGPADQFPQLLSMLRGGLPASIAWRPAHDPKEAMDGDAVFIFGEEDL
jgi:hypothetical protein